jgi:hypothetical protein
MVTMMSMVSNSVQPDLKLFILLQQQLIVELSQGQSMLKDMKLTIMGSLTKSLSFVLSGIRNLK